MEACDDGTDDVLVIDRVSTEVTLSGTSQPDLDVYACAAVMEINQRGVCARISEGLRILILATSFHVYALILYLLLFMKRRNDFENCTLCKDLKTSLFFYVFPYLYS